MQVSKPSFAASFTLLHIDCDVSAVLYFIWTHSGGLVDRHHPEVFRFKYINCFFWLVNKQLFPKVTFLVTVITELPEGQMLLSESETSCLKLLSTLISEPLFSPLKLVSMSPRLHFGLFLLFGWLSCESSEAPRFPHFQNWIVDPFWVETYRSATASDLMTETAIPACDNLMTVLRPWYMKNTTFNHRRLGPSTA